MKFYYIESIDTDFISEGILYVSANNLLFYTESIEDAMIFKTREEAEEFLEDINSETIREFEVFGENIKKYKKNIYGKEVQGSSS